MRSEGEYGRESITILLIALTLALSGEGARQNPPRPTNSVDGRPSDDKLWPLDDLMEVTRLFFRSPIRVVSFLIVLTACAAGTAFAHFETRAEIPTASPPFAAAVGDFNRDGKLDMATANNNLQVFLDMVTNL